MLMNIYIKGTFLMQKKAWMEFYLCKGCDQDLVWDLVFLSFYNNAFFPPDLLKYNFAFSTLHYH